MNPETAVAALGISKLAMGWPLQLASLALMVWLLARNDPLRLFAALCVAAAAVLMFRGNSWWSTCRLSCSAP